MEQQAPKIKISGIDKNAITELKALAKPPQEVITVGAMVLTLLYGSEH